LAGCDMGAFCAMLPRIIGQGSVQAKLLYNRPLDDGR